jgi:hypothetical protein
MSFCYISITLKSIYVYYSCFYASIDRSQSIDGNGTSFFLFISCSKSKSDRTRDSYKIKRNENRAILLYWCLIECILNKRNCQNVWRWKTNTLENMKKSDNDEKYTIEGWSRYAPVLYIRIIIVIENRFLKSFCNHERYPLSTIRFRLNTWNVIIDIINKYTKKKSFKKTSVKQTNTPKELDRWYQ